MSLGFSFCFSYNRTSFLSHLIVCLKWKDDNCCYCCCCIWEQRAEQNVKLQMKRDTREKLNVREGTRVSEWGSYIHYVCIYTYLYIYILWNQGSDRYICIYHSISLFNWIALVATTVLMVHVVPSTCALKTDTLTPCSLAPWRGHYMWWFIYIYISLILTSRATLILNLNSIIINYLLHRLNNWIVYCCPIITD